MKVAVYGIGKNEEKNIAEWIESVIDADYILYLDTGSTDNTLEIARSYGIRVEQAFLDPWDEAIAKNTALSLIPLEYDYCFNLDIDQNIISKNWKEKIVNSGYDDDVLSCSLYLSRGIDISNIIEKMHRIHKRKGMFWTKYRPEIKKNGSVGSDATSSHIDIDVLDKPGDLDRFKDRDSLYTKSFKNYVNNLRNYRKDDIFLQALSSLALSYYEIDDMENFLNIYNEYYSLKEKIKKENVTYSSVNTQEFYLDLAYSMFFPNETKQVYDKWLATDLPDYFKFLTNLRLCIIYHKTNQNDKVQNTLQKIDLEKEYFYVDNQKNATYRFSNIEKEVINFFNNQESVTNIDIESYFKLIFCHTGYGRCHDELTKNCFKYFMEHGYE